MEANVVLVIVGVVSGILLGGGGMFVYLSKLNQSKEAKDSVESLLFAAVPQEALQEVSLLAHRAFDLAERYGDLVQQGILDATEFITDVTDGEPNAAPAVDQ
jgi:hypothetical protein